MIHPANVAQMVKQIRTNPENTPGPSMMHLLSHCVETAWPTRESQDN